MDVISDILRLLNLRSSVYFHSSFCGSWAIDGKNAYQATFHLIARGNCWLHLTEKDASIALTGGDLVVFPRDVAHTISDSQQPPDKTDNPPRPAGADETPTTSLICGYFDFESPQANPLLDAMPDVVHIKNEDPDRTSAMNTLLNFITTETEADAPGSEAVVDKLTEILFIHVIRAYMLQSNTDKGFLAALTDRSLSKVVTTIHKEPGSKWSVDRLAEQAGMSRSAFSKHFQQITDMTPMQYVTRWRMQVAYEALRNTKTSVAVIAERSGYQTEASFRKAFKETTGLGPGAVRKQLKS
jgi:AraC-like DNA-binding protein